ISVPRAIQCQWSVILIWEWRRTSKEDIGISPGKVNSFGPFRTLVRDGWDKGFAAAEPAD
ncbi:MAG: hypothetical protein WBX10_06310, partial [Candidatus Sulfotelmatobacter sp.]